MLSAKNGFLLAFLVGIISLGLNATSFFYESTGIIETKDGPLQGYLSTSRDGRTYAAYLGIPFAEPPIGDLRFEAPVRAKPWKGVLQANKYAPDCYQFDAIVRARWSGVEDCLFLNVFVPETTHQKQKPLTTLVWIHGGGFFSGGAKMYGPKYFMDENVILVTLNYRLGPLGFLSTGDENIRGNMGLKDQRLAMQWVKDNIASFGGDPSKIVIFGESAGGASVHSHILSKSSSALFQKAIIQSGSMNSPWSINFEPKKQAITFGEIVGCPFKDMKLLVQCLKRLDPKELFMPIAERMDDAPFVSLPFSPTIETVAADDAMFLENPRSIQERGEFHKAPVLMGVTSGEGGLRTSRLEASDKDLKTVDENWKEYCPAVLSYDPRNADVTNKIREYYFSDKPFASIPEEFYKNFTLMASDGWFYISEHKAASHHMKQAPVYLYYYDYAAKLPGMYSLMKAVKSKDWLLAELKIAMSILKDYFRWYFGYPGPHDYGACHADDLLQLFNMDRILEIGQRSGDYQFSKKFVKLFVDFATSDEDLKFDGKKWPKMDSSTKKPFLYMKLGQDAEVIEEPFYNRLKFWETLNLR